MWILWHGNLFMSKPKPLCMVTKSGEISLMILLTATTASCELFTFTISGVPPWSNTILSHFLNVCTQ